MIHDTFGCNRPVTLMDKFNGKYRIPSARASWWDYSRDAAYFLTMCTRRRKCFFGSITEHKMILSPTGAIANASWLEITQHARNIELGPYVVMPNHVHGILILAGNDAARITSPRQDDCIQKSPGQLRYRNPGANSISTIIGGYKSAVSRNARRVGLEFGWQPRFHDHIIRDANEFQRIATYIMNNPAKWNDDKFHHL